MPSSLACHLAVVTRLVICDLSGQGVTGFLPTPWSLRETDLSGSVARGGKLDACC
jgi:hypothetical protein